MEEKESININLNAEKVLFACQENLKSYNKLRLKGKGTRDYYYLINVPRLYVVIIDLDDNKLLLK